MTCTGTNDGRRVIRNRHEDTCADGFCTGCEPCPEPHCQVCRRNHAADTCASCIAVVRTNLRNVAAMARRLDAEAQHGRRSLSVGTGVPGGDALVLASPGATTHGAAGQWAHRVTHGLDVTHTQDERRGDPRPPLAVLTRWESTWRNASGQPTDLAPTMGRVVSYLDTHLHRLAVRPEFVAFARDVAACVRSLEDVLRDGERPEVTRVPCWECGTRLVKVYADQAKDDHWTCPRCGERYDRGRFDRAKHDHLASRGAERYVSVADAVATIGRPEQTVRAWIRRGLVDVQRDNITGRLVVWWPHVRAQHMESQERKR